MPRQPAPSSLPRARRRSAPAGASGVSVPRPPQRGTTRRKDLLEALRATSQPLAGDVLAERFGVSRQAIVHDIAVLRAEGAPIIATVRGYLLPRTPERLPHRVTVAVRHRPEQTEDELLAIVDVGVRVADVIVEHPVYGELRGDLGLASPADVRQWSESTRRSGIRFLSELTQGVHLHTLEAASEADLEAARRALAERGYLLSGGESAV